MSTITTPSESVTVSQPAANTEAGAAAVTGVEPLPLESAAAGAQKAVDEMAAGGADKAECEKIEDTGLKVKVHALVEEAEADISKGLVWFKAEISKL